MSKHLTVWACQGSLGVSHADFTVERPVTKVTKIQVPEKLYLDQDNHALCSPIHLSTKFSFPRVKDLQNLFAGKRQGYLYSRFSNPTVRELEMELAKRQGCDDAICCSSGVAAISSTLLSNLAAGDKVMLFIESYKPSRYLSLRLLKKFGVESVLLSLRDPKLAEKIRSEKPNLILFESPTNPCLFLADLQLITETARSIGALTVLDNTFAGLSEHHQFPVDVYIHSLSKQANGHGDVTGGVVISNSDWIESHRNDFIQLGSCLDPHAAYLVLRGLKTLKLREEAQSKSAQIVAEFLATQADKVSELRFPGLSTHPQYRLAKDQLRSCGYVMSCDIGRNESEMHKFIEALHGFHLTGSLGSTESVVAPSHLFYSGELTQEQLVQSGIRPNTIRLSIGLESPESLIKCVSKALKVLS